MSCVTSNATWRPSAHWVSAGDRQQWIALKAQVSGHTPFYQSDLRELGKDALQLIVGGTLAFSPQTSLDIGVSEDIIVRTSPDVAFHLALKRLF